MANLVLVPKEKSAKGHSASANAKMTNCLIIREIAIHVAATKLFLMEHVSAQLDIHAIHVEYALFHAELDNLCSRVLVQYALLTPSSTQLSTAAAALKVSTWILTEFAKNYK